MSGQQNQKRENVLRVALVVGDEPVQETIVKDGEVTIGQSQRNTFAVPLETLPTTWKLIEKQGDRYVLRVNSHMDGRIASAKERKMLSQLTANAKKDGDGWLIPLSDKSWGKIELGPLKILFQFIKEPPVIPKPTLPASVRGSLLVAVPVALIVCLGVSLAFFGSLVGISYARYVPKSNDFVSRVARDILEPQADPIVINAPPIEDDGEDEKDEKTAEKVVKKAPPKKPKASDGGKDKEPKEKPAGGGGDPEARRAAADRELTTFMEGLAIDGGDGADGPGIGSREPGKDVGKQADAVRKSGETVAVGGGTDRIRGSGEDARVGTGKGPDLSGSDGGTTTAGTKAKETVPKGRVKISGKEADDDTTLTPGKVVSRIKSRYLRGLQRCYNDELKGNGRASGKVTISFTVNESGRTTRAKASGVSSSLSSCIKRRMGSWRFPAPKDEDGEATDASFRVTLALSSAG